MPLFEELATKVLLRIRDPLRREEQETDSPVPDRDAREADFERGLGRYWEARSDLEGHLRPRSPENIGTDLDRPALTEAERADIEAAVWSAGIEALAFYKSIHQRTEAPFPGSWGVFILDHGIAYLAEELRGFYPKRSFNPSASEVAARFLYHHEFFHFKVDAWTVIHEAFTEKSLQAKYLRDSYRVDFPSIYCVEESLANRHAFRSMSSFKIEKFLRNFMRVQPPCYAGWKERPKGEFIPGWTIEQVLGGAILGGCSVNELKCRAISMPCRDVVCGPEEVIEYVSSSPDVVASSAECPIHQVSSGRISTVKFPALVPDLGEMKHFVEGYLGGTSLPRTDHAYYQIDNGEKVKFPNPHYKNIELHEFGNILHKAGMRRDEFDEEREKTHRWRRNIPRHPPKPPFRSDDR